MKYLKKPLSLKQVKKLANEDLYLTNIVSFHIGELIEGDFEFFLDECSERLIDNIQLTDISYKVVGTDKELILVQVTGCVADYLEFIKEGSL